jgi:hypothetical protein
MCKCMQHSGTVRVPFTIVQQLPVTIYAVTKIVLP